MLFSLRALRETKSYSSESKNEHKEETTPVPFGIQASVLLPDTKQVASTWVRQPTLADGDCALHAIFGQPNSTGIYECPHIVQRRKVLCRRVEECKPKSRVHQLALESIKELIISKRAIGSESARLLDKHQQFLHEQSKLSPELWNKFESMLRKNKVVMEYIETHHKHKDLSANLRARF